MSHTRVLIGNVMLDLQDLYGGHDLDQSYFICAFLISWCFTGEGTEDDHFEFDRKVQQDRVFNQLMFFRRRN